MKVRGHILLSLLTVFVLAFSFALPKVVAKIQDRLNEAQVESRAIQEIKLSIERSEENPMALLEFVSLEYEIMELHTPVNARGAMEQYEVAREILGFFEKEGITLLHPEQFDIHREISFFVKSATSEDVRLMWRCYMVDEARDIVVTLVIDDATGTLLSFSVITESASAIAPLQTWADILTKYYGFTQGTIVRDNLWFTDETGTSIECPILSSESYFSFNHVLIYGQYP